MNKSLILLLISTLLLSSYLYFSLDKKAKIIEELQKDLAIKNYESSICASKLDEQNRVLQSIKAKEIIEPKNIEKIKKIEVKDEKCEAMLRAYERLFDSSF